ncbi:hypothetical protein CRM22_011151 [Opisthorchis felineus]|uniref:Secretory carrier-associated membrane protein n=1 Tax=Opisthorchis felineus TaxID=147828 RepID=A0A4S2K9Q8_OPIFE|nr:hypothetical protein CRM22_011151 [Opisthorchis felineus]
MMASDDAVENPFNDPVERLTTQTPSEATASTTSRIQTGALGDYNPFERDTSTLTGTIASNPDFPPPYSSLEAQRLTTTELERRQKELDAKAAELARREAEQNRLAEQVRQGPIKNWPPLPSFFPCEPCFYQDIDLEINSEYRRIVRFGYYLWVAYAGLLLINFLGALLYFAGTGRSDGGSLFGVSIIICIFCIPASFICWFRPLYKAFRSDSSINFFIFFIVFGAQILVLIIQALGILNWGSCGWITGLAAVKETPAIGGITLAIACFFTGMAVACALYLIRTLESSTPSIQTSP